MKKSFSVLLYITIAFSILVTAGSVHASAAGAAYYVSSSEGNDANPGTESAPWQSLDRVSAEVFGAGDSVYLKRGDVFEGAVTLNGNGTQAEPITLGAYGSGERPFIKGPGNPAARHSCVTIPAQSQGWRLVGLEIGEGFHGIYIRIDDGAGNDGYWIEDCYIHDSVNWVGSLPFGHAITIKGTVEGMNTASRITVKNCIFKGNDRDFFPDNLEYGIFLSDVHIDGCTFLGGGYNSIYHTCGTRFHITDSLWTGCGRGTIPVGNACIISGELTGGPDTNLVTGNEFAFTRDPGGADGCAYDFEIPTDGITFAGNFVHNSVGQAVMIMPGAVCSDIRIADNIFYRNLRETQRHKGELALYGGGTGTVTGNVFQTTLRFDHFTRAMEGDASGLRISGNRIQNLTRDMPGMPTITFDPVTGTATLSGPPGVSLYYTTDGSVPTRESRLYRCEAIPIGQTTALNCRAYYRAALYPGNKNTLPGMTRSRVLTPYGAAYGSEQPEEPGFLERVLQPLKNLVDWVVLVIS